mmetsp:Transcript_74447/g.118411  ORF Transcript_74447/g.118411 Transcript_74447/m.118411 type:complete len:226 (-) Transcript_74447:1372-2049(-)
MINIAMGYGQSTVPGIDDELLFAFSCVFEAKLRSMQIFIPPPDDRCIALLAVLMHVQESATEQLETVPMLVVEGYVDSRLPWNCHFSRKAALFFGGHQRCIQILTAGKPTVSLTLDLQNIMLDSALAFHVLLKNFHAFLTRTFGIFDFDHDLLGSMLEGFWGALETHLQVLTSQPTERPPGHVQPQSGEFAISRCLRLGVLQFVLDLLYLPRRYICSLRILKKLI